MLQSIAFWPNGRSDLFARQARPRHAGISLLEVAMLMVIVTLALVPVIHNIGGPTSSQGNAARVVGNQSKEILLANTLIEQALANDFKTFNCNGAFDPNNFPSQGQSSNFPAGSRCTNTSYNQALYYQWSVHNMEQANSLMPVGNKYYNAVLNVYTTASGGTPLLSLPTSFFWNKSGTTPVINKTGIIIVQDISGSMAQSSGAGTAGGSSSGLTASPFLRARYNDPKVGYIAANPLNLYNNKQLDIVAASNVDDPLTPQDERYLSPGILGAPNCKSNGNVNSAQWLPSNFYATTGMNVTQQNAVQNICNRVPGFMDVDMSRVEASRSSLLSFLVSMETDPMLYQNTLLGFMTFSSGGATGNTLRVPLEAVNQNNQYQEMRREISWMNRDGPGIIPAGGGTWMYESVRDGAKEVFGAPGLNNRIILLVTDGQPNGNMPNQPFPASNHLVFQALAKSIGNGTFPGSNGNTATIFTLGLVFNKAAMQPWLDTDLASQTPGGQFFYAQNVANIGPIFDQIKYQIQRVILLNKSNRYNVNMS